MRKELAFKGIVKMLSGIIVMGLLMFIPAGTFNFPGAWRMIVLLSLLMIVLGSVLLIFKPELLAKRLSSKETQNEQKSVILYSLIIFILCFIICGLDFRFGVSFVPNWLTIIGCFVFIITYLGFAELLRENEFLSRTVEVHDNQHVVSTGLYGIVRHPMYAIIFSMFISMPIIIGSYLGLIPMIFLPVILAKRILNEEEVLNEGLPGYKEYTKKVKYRIIPFIW